MEGEKLYTAFSSALDKNLDEVGFVVSTSEFETGESKGASTDVKPFLVVEQKLAVAYWCLPTLLNYAQDLYFKTKKSSPSDVDTLIKTTRVLIIGNADTYYALNTRKRLLVAGHLNFRDELTFLELVFTKYPKSVESWSHRRWVLTKLFEREKPISQYVDREMKLCSKISDVYPKNYYAWSHRQWVLQHVDDINIFVGDLKAMEDWTRRHVGDHCGFHHREFVLLQIFKLKGLDINSVNMRLRGGDLVSSMQCLSLSKEQKVDEGVLNLMRKEFYFTERLVIWYPGHEVVWYHRRFIFFYWCWIVLSLPVEKQCEFFDWKDLSDEKFPLDDYVSPTMEKVEDESLVKWPSISRELCFAQMCMNDSDVINYAQQKQCASAYILWIFEIGLHYLSKSALDNKEKLHGIYKEYLDNFVKKLDTSSWVNRGVVNMYK